MGKCPIPRCHADFTGSQRGHGFFGDRRVNRARTRQGCPPSNQINAKLRADWAAFETADRISVMADYRGSVACSLTVRDYDAMSRRIAEISVQVLSGAMPGDLPIEQPTKVEFVMNLKVARSIVCPSRKASFA